MTTVWGKFSGANHRPSPTTAVERGEQAGRVAECVRCMPEWRGGVEGVFGGGGRGGGGLSH